MTHGNTKSHETKRSLSGREAWGNVGIGVPWSVCAFARRAHDGEDDCLDKLGLVYLTATITVNLYATTIIITNIACHKNNDET